MCARAVALQAQEVAVIRRNYGELQAGAAAAAAQAEAAAQALSAERDAAAARQAHYTSLVSDLRGRIEALTKDLHSARGARALADSMAAAAARKVMDLEYTVGKAREREALLGLHGMVPEARVDRGVQVGGGKGRRWDLEGDNWEGQGHGQGQGEVVGEGSLLGGSWSIQWAVNGTGPWLVC